MSTLFPDFFRELIEPAEDAWLSPLTKGFCRFGLRGFTCFQSFAFHFHIDLNIAMSGIHIRMTKPVFDNTDVISRLKQVHGRCVPERVRTYIFRLH